MNANNAYDAYKMHAYEMAVYGRDARLWESHAHEMAVYGRSTPMGEPRL